MDGMVIGGTLLVGINNASGTASDPENFPFNPDTNEDGESLLGLILGLSIDGDMPMDFSLSIVQENEGDYTEDISAGTGNVVDTMQESVSLLDIDVSGRVGIDNWLVALGISYLMGSEEEISE